MTHLALVAALVIAANPTSKEPNAATAKAANPTAAWRLLPTSGSGCGEDLSSDYGADGGMRNFFCRALTVFSWKTFMGLVPAAPFASGPHRGGKLDLNAKKQFGHYRPAFVKWATTALVPAAFDPALREQTQAVYDLQVRALARVYFKVWRTLSAEPQWLSKERAVYAAAMEKGEADWASPAVDLYHETLGPSAQGWGGNDPNLVRSATMWWLRRSLDETASQWAVGLERLLKTYDAAWLEAERSRKPVAPPGRAATPEVR